MELDLNANNALNVKNFLLNYSLTVKCTNYNDFHKKRPSLLKRF